MNLLRLLAVLLFVSAVRADMMPPPFQRTAVSADSEFLVRVDTGRRREGETERSPDRVSIHHYDTAKRQYIKVSDFAYGERPGSGFLFVSNGGKYVMGVNVGAWIGFEKLGLRLYDQKGKLLKVWRVEDFLTPVEIDGCAKTGSTVQWFQSGGFSYDTEKFEFSGPASHIAGWGSSFTVMQGAKEGLGFRFSVDLKSLTLKRE